MTELELKIEMIELLIHNDDQYVTTYKAFEQHTGAAIDEIRAIVKNLVGLGFIELESAWDGEGMLKGSGYVLTQRATQWSIREWLQQLKDIKRLER